MMNKKIIIPIVAFLLIFVVGFVSVQFLGLSLPFTNNEEDIVEYEFPIGGTIITNIKGSRSYVKCDIVLTIVDEDEYYLMKENSYKIKDAIIEVLRAMEENDYYQDGLQKTLGDKIITKLNESFGYEHVDKVFFEQLITQ
ncbi:MAG: flagellar basal body-associated protein FliL [Clostridia bacterium]